MADLAGCGVGGYDWGMASEREKSRHWQFGTKHLFGVVTIFAISLAVPPPFSFVVCMIAFPTVLVFLKEGEHRAAGYATVIAIASFIRHMTSPDI